MTDIRNNWKLSEVQELFALPFSDLVFKAQTIHREFHDPNAVQISTLMSIKTGGCPEDCKYCPQSAHYDTPVEATKLSELDEVKKEAAAAKAAGASRFCMGAAWRTPKERDIPKVISMIEAVKELGMESCMTLGMLEEHQAKQLKEAGLDYYNHNIDTSEEFYKEIISTRTYQDRLDTLENVRKSGMKTCSGGIVGMGESVDDRASMLLTLANMEEHPHSVPVNMLVRVEGTPYAENSEVSALDFVRTIAVARIIMPKAAVRLSAGREEMSDETQAMAFLAGANSIFYGEKLLTTANPEANEDIKLFENLGIKPMAI